MTAPRTYAVGARVVTTVGSHPGADVGVVAEVRDGVHPYRIDFGEATAEQAWWSGLDLAPAPEIYAVDPVLTAVRKARVDGEFSSVAEHIAAWKRGGRRWARVAGFNVDAWQAERADAAATTLAADPVMAVLCGVPAVIGEPTPAEDLAAAYCAKVEAARGGGLADALKPAVMAYSATEHPASKGVDHQGGAIRVSMMVAALELITRDGCETSTSGIGSCVTSRRTPDARYAADRWCRPCVAWHALNGAEALKPAVTPAEQLQSVVMSSLDSAASDGRLYAAADNHGTHMIPMVKSWAPGIYDSRQFGPGDRCCDLVIVGVMTAGQFIPISGIHPPIPWSSGMSARVDLRAFIAEGDR